MAILMQILLQKLPKNRRQIGEIKVDPILHIVYTRTFWIN